MSEQAPACGAGEVTWPARLAVSARLILSLLIIGGLVASVAACGGRQKLSKRVVEYGQKVPKGGGKYHVGKPYAVGSKTYHPREDPNYNRVGLASWYGDLFHGRYTANGEIYDMDRLSAAHPTMPLPSYARVTNLHNGRSVVVRVNDRGPFSNDRIIDLSRRSAEALGFRRNGTATVRVAYLGRAPLNGDDSYERRYLASQSFMQMADARAAPPANKRIVSLAEEEAKDAKYASSAWRLGSPAAATPPQPAKPGQGVNGSVTIKGGFLIQAGMFKQQENVDKARAALSPIASVEVSQVEFRGEMLSRVRIGPFPDRKAARAALGKVTKAGYAGARIVN